MHELDLLTVIFGVVLALGISLTIASNFWENAHPHLNNWAFGIGLTMIVSGGVGFVVAGILDLVRISTTPQV